MMISTLVRSQVDSGRLARLLVLGFAAAVAHARLRLSRLELIGGSGRTAGGYASAARAFIRRPPSYRLRAGAACGDRGGALGVWERVAGWRQGRVRWGRPL